MIKIASRQILVERAHNLVAFHRNLDKTTEFKNYTVQDWLQRLCGQLVPTIWTWDRWAQADYRLRLDTDLFKNNRLLKQQFLYIFLHNRYCENRKQTHTKPSHSHPQFHKLGNNLLELAGFTNLLRKETCILHYDLMGFKAK